MSKADSSDSSGIKGGSVLSTSNQSLPHLESFYNEHPSPTVDPDQKTVDMFKYYLRAREEHGFKLIESIRSNKDFGNPYILSKVVQHYNIDQFGTNFPKDVFDPEEVTAEGFEESIKRRRVDGSAAPAVPVAGPSSASASVTVTGMASGLPQPPLAGYAAPAGAAAALAAAVASINSAMSGANVDSGAASTVREDSARRKSKWG